MPPYKLIGSGFLSILHPLCVLSGAELTCPVIDWFNGSVFACTHGLIASGLVMWFVVSIRFTKLDVLHPLSQWPQFRKAEAIVGRNRTSQESVKLKSQWITVLVNILN